MSLFHKCQRKGLIRLGNLYVPGDEELPSFEKSGAFSKLPLMLSNLPKKDRYGLQGILVLFSFTPAVLIRVLLWVLLRRDHFVHPLKGFLSTLELGLKGTVMSLYYSDFTEDREIFDKIAWLASVKENNNAPYDNSEKIGDPLKKSIEEAEKMLESQDQKVPAKRAETNHTNRTTGDVHSVFKNSRQAFEEIQETSLHERVAILHKLRKVIVKEKDKICDEIHKATKKPKSDALMSEVFGVLDHLQYLEKFSTEILQEEHVYTPPALMGKKSKIYYEALGTILVISPWNYPLYEALVPITSAFMAGNAVVYKPSEWTPMKGLLEGLFEKAGLSSQWIQVVYGDGSVGEACLEQGPDKVFFTGSARTGRAILKAASKQLIPVELELGGKDPMLVFDDANLKRAVPGALWGSLTNTGQACTSVERLLIQSSVYDEFRDQLVKKSKMLHQDVEDPDHQMDLGAMTTPFQVKIVKEHLDDAREKGAKLLTGEDWDGEDPCIPPIIVENIKPDMKIYQEETFGPVIPMMAFEDEEEAIRKANDSAFGLSASVWSSDHKKAERVARAVKTGNVSINNVMVTEGNAALPFGGVKQSGFGRHKGRDGLRSFCYSKSVILDKDSSKQEVNWFPYTKVKFKLFSKLIDNLFGQSGLKRWIAFAYHGLRLEMLSHSKRPQKKRKRKS
jgi:aldehyde dehydrogenase (NAD+)